MSSKRELAALIFIAFLLVAGFAVWANLPNIVSDFNAFELIFPYRKGINFNISSELGAEYFNLASSMAARHEFANPFAVPTGPSAWMPPLFPALMALLLGITGSKSAVVVCMVSLQAIAVFFAIAAPILILDRQGYPFRVKIFALIFSAAWLLLNFCWFFQSIHDIAILLLLTSCMLLALQPLLGSAEILRIQWSRWSILGGLTVLSSPILALSWAVLSAVAASKRRAWRPVVASLILPLVLLGLWTARNYVALDRLIFIKSNLAFELLQANVLSADGVYTSEDFSRHPYSIAQQDENLFRSQFGSSENEIVDRARERFSSYLASNPGDFAAKISRRALAATFKYPPFISGIDSPVPWWRYVVFALPALSATALLFRIKRLSSFQIGCIIFYAAFLTPYVVSAFYIRYLLPLTPALVLFVSWGATRGPLFSSNNSKAGE